MDIKHKHHVQLLLCTLVLSSGLLVLSILWEMRIINLPPSVVYYARVITNQVDSYPKANVLLSLNFHKQIYSLSCEAATLRMVLNYHGIDVAEEDVIAKMPFDKTPRSGNIWGDPHAGFVGRIDGRMMVDGYGIHWEGLAVTASQWKETKILKNGLATDLAEHVSEGRPVIVWGYLGRGQPVSWQTPEGKKIYGVNGEHTRIVYGFRGSVENPEGFFVMDPTYGKAYWEKDEFMRNWDGLGRMGIVVYP